MAGIGSAIGGIFGGGGGGRVDERTTTTRNEIDPALRPYVDFGLSEARRLYEAPGPSYFPGKTYVGPSDTTLSALRAGETRAAAGSPLLREAQAENLANIQGKYLSGNPFFEGAFNPAARAAQQSYYDAIQNVSSKAASAGRYGSGAYGQLTDRAGGTFATALTDIAGKLSYENYENERKRQAAATAAAPGMAEADYGDIQRLLAIGQGREAYSEKELQDEINRYNYEQNLPSAKLQSFLSGVYGAPSGGVSTSTQPIYSDPGKEALGNLLGIAGTAANVYTAFSDIRTKENIVNIGNGKHNLPVYIFEYKPEWKDEAGHGKFVGYMAHDVEKVAPQAVRTRADGIKQVCYALV
jgi:hypothetical protein